MRALLGQILADHFRRYPRLQIVDLYKLLHQASMGSEHAVSDQAGVRAWLERELATMGPGPEDPLIEPISPGGEVVRVHLRPYMEAGHDPQLLLAAFLRTAQEFRGSTARLQSYWAVAEEMAAAGRVPLPPERLAEFLPPIAHQGFPAVHHSTVYAKLYRPAYRVVARAFLALRA